MKHLKSYKLFESVDLIPLVSTINDIALDLTDEGYEVLVDVNDESIRIEVSSPCKENLYSKWKQDRENFAKREYEKCKSVLDRIDDFLVSSGLEVVSKNNTWESDQLEYGTIHRCYDDNETSSNWYYEIIYKPSSVNEGFLSNRKWWFQKGKKDPDRLFNKDLKLDINDAFCDMDDLGFEVVVNTPDPDRIEDSRERSKEMVDANWYEKTITVDISKNGNNTFSFEELMDQVIFMISFLKDKWDIELRTIDGTWSEPRVNGRSSLRPIRSKMRKPYQMNIHYFDKHGLRRDKRSSLFRTGLPAYNEVNLRNDFMRYFGCFGDSIVELVFTFKID